MLFGCQEQDASTLPLRLHPHIWRRARVRLEFLNLQLCQLRWGSSWGTRVWGRCGPMIGSHRSEVLRTRRSTALSRTAGSRAADSRWRSRQWHVRRCERNALFGRYVRTACFCCTPLNDMFYSKNHVIWLRANSLHHSFVAIVRFEQLLSLLETLGLPITIAIFFMSFNPVEFMSVYVFRKLIDIASENCVFMEHSSSTLICK